MIVSFVCIAQFRWYSTDSIGGKYKWLIVGFVATLLWTCIVLNAYAWKKPKIDPATLCNSGNGLYVSATKQCLTLSNPQGLSSCVGLGSCLCITQHAGLAWQGYCTNCTANPCYPRAAQARSCRIGATPSRRPSGPESLALNRSHHCAAQG